MITASDISFERHYEPVFEPVSLELDAGELLLVTGSNGSGKTTLIRILAGLLQPLEGSVQRNCEQFAYVGHFLAVKDDLTVRENLEFVCRFMGHSATSVDEAIKTMGLSGAQHQEARTLSAGQRKRCALARLVLCDASLWLLDEPYSNLDQQGMGMMDTLLAAHLEHGGACIMTTHGSLRPANQEASELELIAARHAE